MSTVERSQRCETSIHVHEGSYLNNRRQIFYDEFIDTGGQGTDYDWCGMLGMHPGPQGQGHNNEQPGTATLRSAEDSARLPLPAAACQDVRLSPRAFSKRKQVKALPLRFRMLHQYTGLMPLGHNDSPDRSTSGCRISRPASLSSTACCEPSWE